MYFTRGFPLVLALALLAPSASASGDTLVAPSKSEVMSLSEYGGDFAWRRYLVRLESNVGGPAADLPVSNGWRETDVDLGKDPRGSLVAVYNGCPVGCKRVSYDLFTYDFTTGRSTPIRYADRTNCIEELPAISHGVVVFYRAGSDCAKGLWAARLGSKPVRLSSEFIRATDIDGDLVAFVRTANHRPDEVRLQRVGSTHSCSVERAPRNVDIDDVQLAAGRVYWSFTLDGDDRNGRVARANGCRTATRMHAPGRRISKRRVPLTDYVLPIAVDSRGNVYYGGDGIFRLDDPAPF